MSDYTIVIEVPTDKKVPDFFLEHIRKQVTAMCKKYATDQVKIETRDDRRPIY